MSVFRRRGERTEPLPAGADARPLDADEQQQIGVLVASLRSTGVDIDDPRSLGTAYDATLMAWTVRPHPSRSEAEPLITMLGAGIGQHLVDHAQLSWRMAGGRFAVTAGSGEPLFLPVDLVAERWARGELGWLPDMLIETRRNLARDDDN